MKDLTYVVEPDLQTRGWWIRKRVGGEMSKGSRFQYSLNKASIVRDARGLCRRQVTRARPHLRLLILRADMSIQHEHHYHWPRRAPCS